MTQESDITGNSNEGSGFGLDDLTKLVTGLGGTANTLYNSVTGKTPPANTTKQPALAASTVSSKLITYLPWIIGGGLVLVLGVLFLGRKK